MVTEMTDSTAGGDGRGGVFPSSTPAVGLRQTQRALSRQLGVSAWSVDNPSTDRFT